MALKHVKNKIVATEKTGKVTKAMEAVSAVKMRKSQARALRGKAYAEAALRILLRISKSRDANRFFARVGIEPSEKECVIVITSDKGLAGSINSGVLKEVDIYLSNKRKEHIHIITFGKKAHEHYMRAGLCIDMHHTNVSDAVLLEDMFDVVKFVTDNFNQNTYGRVSIAYQSFISTFEQTAILRQILPLDALTLETMVRDIIPKTGQFSDVEKDLTDHLYTVEPSIEEVAESLMHHLIQIMVYHALLENKASEHSARMVAMKNATDKSVEMIKELTLLYNKERQTAITAEVSEITGGIEAMRQV